MSLERARTYYDEFSHAYEARRRPNDPGGYHALIDDLEIELTERYGAGKDVLECGCGTGLILERIKGYARRAVGIDLSPGMLDHARARGLEVREGSVTALPFEDATFDVTCSFKVLAHVPDIGRALAEMTWDEVSRVALAPGITIPSLQQVLTAVADRAMVYVELKGSNSERATLDLITGAAEYARCAVHSFDHAAIIRAARLAPTVRRGILFDAYPDDIDSAMRDTGALDVWPEWTLVDAPLVERIHAGGGHVIAWTVNTTAAAARLVRLGVDGLCSDDVRLLPK